LHTPRQHRPADSGPFLGPWDPNKQEALMRNLRRFMFVALMVTLSVTAIVAKRRRRGNLPDRPIGQAARGVAAREFADRRAVTQQGALRSQRAAV
jgi:hypothetical protein